MKCRVIRKFSRNKKTTVNVQFPFNIVLTWHGCNNENQKKIERMQNRAGRLLLKDSRELTSEAIIEKLGWKPLSVRRDEHTTELVKNCLNSFVPDLFKDYFNTRHCEIHSYNTSSRRNLYIDKINLEITKRVFFI